MPASAPHSAARHGKTPSTHVAVTAADQTANCSATVESPQAHVITNHRDKLRRDNPLNLHPRSWADVASALHLRHEVRDRLLTLIHRADLIHSLDILQDDNGGLIATDV